MSVFQNSMAPEDFVGTTLGHNSWPEDKSVQMEGKEELSSIQIVLDQSWGWTKLPKHRPLVPSKKPLGILLGLQLLPQKGLGHL